MSVFFYREATYCSDTVAAATETEVLRKEGAHVTLASPPFGSLAAAV